VAEKSAVARSLALDHGAAYGEAFADVYDRWYHQVTDSDAAAEFVARRCPSGLVVELGVGTGRLARPLVDRGLTVVGIDTSGPMLDGCPSSVLRVRADMTLLPLVSTGGTGALRATALCGFNTVFNLPTAEAQISLFQELAPLADIVIVETLNAELLADAPARSTGVGRILSDGVVVSSTVGQRADQRLIGRHLEIVDEGVRVRPWMLRWATVDQLDAMAARADYICCERWGSWTEEGFDARSRASISVYRHTVTR
jgi:SAM-dependent methyltransferase